MIVDYHMHLRGPSQDGSEPLVHTLQTVERYVERAVECGVDEIGFSEHVYYFAQTREVWRLPYHLERCKYDIEAYCDAVLEGKRRGLPVKLGLEIDHVPGRQKRLAELLDQYPWDFLLGSVHEVLESPIDQRPGIWEDLSVEEVWRGYFASLLELAQSGAVDVMAHPDLAKIYGHFPDRDAVEELHELGAKELAAAGVAIEISTAGLRKPIGEIYPSEPFLRALHRYAVPITTASDAHQSRLVGDELRLAVELARKVGYETVSVFERRQRRQRTLG